MGQWCFPVGLAPVKMLACEAVFSFVLRGAAAVIVDGVPCIGLSHGLEDGAAKHPYLGTSRVLEDLAALPGYGDGFVELMPGQVVRDVHTGLICGLAPPIS